MRTPKIIRVLTALYLGGISVQQLHAGPYSGIVVFGDSISDVGNWPISESARFPGGVFPPPYFGGRISNGPLWAEHLANHLGLAAPTPSLAGGTNYAWAGGTTGSIRGEDVNMDVQVSRYLSQHSPEPDELFVLWGGTNDFFLGQMNPSAPVAYIKDQVFDLAAAGARNFLVVNLPSYFGSSSLNSRLTQRAEEFNSLLSSAFDGVRSTLQEVTIFEFDYFSFFEKVTANPAEFGFSNVLDPACRNCVSANRTVVPNPDEYFFWDDVHPTAAAHRLIGDATYAILAVPEPSTLLVFITGILCVVAGCRRTRRVGQESDS
jgi:phospholipase/lecithinase/hemolysin